MYYCPTWRSWNTVTCLLAVTARHSAGVQNFGLAERVREEACAIFGKYQACLLSRDSTETAKGAYCIGAGQNAPDIGEQHRSSKASGVAPPCTLLLPSRARKQSQYGYGSWLRAPCIYCRVSSSSTQSLVACSVRTRLLMGMRRSHPMARRQEADTSLCLIKQVSYPRDLGDPLLCNRD